ncbi:MAG: hypothetical protein ACLFNU_10565 [Bacteroidales bacterium]
MAKTELSENFSVVSDVLKGYLKSKIDLLKLELLQKYTNAGVHLLTSVSVIISAFAACIFLMFSFSFWYGNRTGSLDQGFLISAGFFAFIIVLLIVFRKAIFSRNLIKVFSSILFTDEEN